MFHAQYDRHFSLASGHVEFDVVVSVVRRGRPKRCETVLPASVIMLALFTHGIRVRTAGALYKATL